MSSTEFKPREWWIDPNNPKPTTDKEQRPTLCHIKVIEKEAFDSARSMAVYYRDLCNKSLLDNALLRTHIDLLSYRIKKYELKKTRLKTKRNGAKRAKRSRVVSLQAQ